MNFWEKLFKNNNRNYEDKLLKKFGECKKLDKHISLLLIADTHNCLGNNQEMLEYLKSTLKYDYCILLGDHSAKDLEEILNIIPKEKIFGVLGNHDTWNKYEEFGIDNINGKIVELKGIKFAGISGSFKYKDSDQYALYTHEESIQIASNMDSADILISHDKPFIEDNHNHAHDGLKGITEYIYKNHVSINIHGHLHEDTVEHLKNGTKVIGIYGCKIINI